MVADVKAEVGILESLLQLKCIFPRRGAAEVVEALRNSEGCFTNAAKILLDANGANAAETGEISQLSFARDNPKLEQPCLGGLPPSPPPQGLPKSEKGEESADRLELREVQAQVQGALEELSAGLLERDVEVRLVLLAALAGQHVLLLGPPGCGKSELGRRLHRVFGDAEDANGRASGYFERLLTKFSTPEELFGPLSITALEQDKYERNMKGYLPTARVAFLDEVFKANSAILNGLLTVMNERLFHNGSQVVRVPLQCLLGASNELPESEELAALHDRFLLRLHVEPLSEFAFGEYLDLLDAPTAPAPPCPRVAGARNTLALLRLETVVAVQAAATQEPLPKAVMAFLGKLREDLQAPDVLHGAPCYISDRRWLAASKLMQVAAVSSGRRHTGLADLLLLRHCLWTEASQRSPLCELLTAAVTAYAKDVVRGAYREAIAAGVPAVAAWLDGADVAALPAWQDAVSRVRAAVGGAVEALQDLGPSTAALTWLAEEDLGMLEQ
eukprot:gene19382-23174_t